MDQLDWPVQNDRPPAVAGGLLRRGRVRETPGAGAAPPIRRGWMTPIPWVGLLGADKRAPQQPSQAASGLRRPWQFAAARRRLALLGGTALSTLTATALLIANQGSGHPFLEGLQALLFALLFAWICAGFMTALMGFLAQTRGDCFALSMEGLQTVPIDPEARTAIVMPICNEHVETVFAGLRATCESLLRMPSAPIFDIYVLSDTSDPELAVAEFAAWAELRDLLGARLCVYYRWRKRRTRRKAGNVADFCRRWGRNYRYMVVLDADSVMTGACLTWLVRLMEARPRTGIIQTAPVACGADTRHARTQQLAARVTGRLFTAGMHYWQLGESHYWGHNAIVRVEPFMRHCALAGLPGKGGLSGDILSHDFIEAALMVRGGYEVWLAPDLAGSYEQSPSNLLEELRRDRRWCQGNLMNLRLIAQPGVRPVHRAMLATGAMSYLSAPLWCAFLLVGLVLMLRGGGAAAPPSLMAAPSMAMLWMVTLVMLFSPRLLAIVLIAVRGEAAEYGGMSALIRGVALESAMSALDAPVRMVAHSLFVFASLTGFELVWKSPPRESNVIRVAEAAARFGPMAAVSLVALVATFGTNVGAALWLLPVGLPLLMAPLLSILGSRGAPRGHAHGNTLLCTPEEFDPPMVLRRARTYRDALRFGVPEPALPRCR